jgi:hypothetical protein
MALFSFPNLPPNSTMQKEDSPSHQNAGSFVVLCETNILSLINQCLDNYYQIKTKIATVLNSDSGSPEFGI